MIVTFLRDLFGGSRVVPSDSKKVVANVKNGSKRCDKYGSDVEALKERYRIEFETGVCIGIPLKEILVICPRERRRVDAYTGLVTHLKREYGITLKITSNKTKSRNYANKKETSRL